MKTVISAQEAPLQNYFAVSLPFELTAGRYAIVRWKSPTAKWISFNFGEGTFFDKGKVVFHYNPRYEANAVIRTAKDGSWGPEERGDGMPCKVGVIHEAKFVVRPDFYECFVDGVKHTEFKHRLPLNIAKFFFVGGEGEVHYIAFGDEATDQATTCCKQDLTVPYSTPCGIAPGRKIYVSGTPPADEKKFRTILKAGEDYALCFAVRMGQSTVFMNSYVDGKWEREQRPKEFPFKAGEFCNILIEVQTDRFKVSVNDQPFAEFKHRVLPLAKITTLDVDGEFNLCCAKVF